VLTTVSDKKIPVDDGNNGTIDWYVADITSATDYYPFGSPMDGRTFSSEKYRFGFNGKENDNEVKGEGNSLDYGARIYDSRLGRWMALDPMMAKYPNESPYTYAGNNPTYLVDISGKTKKTYLIYTDENGKSMPISVSVDKDFTEKRYTHHSYNISVGKGEGEYVFWDTKDEYDVDIIYNVSSIKGKPGLYKIEKTIKYTYKPKCYEKSFEGKGEVVPGGIVFVGDGGASPTKNKSKSEARMTPIQELLDALSVLGQGEPSIIGNTSLGSEVADKINDIAGLIEKAQDLNLINFSAKEKDKKLPGNVKKMIVTVKSKDGSRGISTYYDITKEDSAKAVNKAKSGNSKNGAKITVR